MAANLGNQLVSLIYYATATSAVVNQRFLDIRPTGIYSGGRLAIVDNTHASLEVLVCEIGDGDHQVRIQTQEAVSVVVGSATSYVVLRWAHVEAQANDYMSMVGVATPAANDLVVGSCTFSGAGVLLGFNYGDTTYPRSNPDDHQSFLKVIPTADTELQVLITAGYVQGTAGSTHVPEQKSGLIIAPTANSKIYLIYVNPDTGAVSVDSSGAEAATPTAPDYDGKLVLAEVTLATGATNITVCNIVDTRAFLSKGPDAPDDVYIQRNSSGQLSLVDYSVGKTQISRYAQFDTVPGWYLAVKHNYTSTVPGDFNDGDSEGRYLSLGQITTTRHSLSSYLYKMQIFNATGAAKAVAQTIKMNNLYCYFFLNNTVTPFDTSSIIYLSSKIITWNLSAGINDLYIVSRGGVVTGNMMYLNLMGDIVNGTDVYFLGDV